MSAPARDYVFISYSHVDEVWRNRVRMFLKDYVPEGLSTRGVTQRTCCSGEEAGCPQLDGKTLCTFTTT